MDGDYFQGRSGSDEHPLPSPSDTPYQTPQLSSSTRFSSFNTDTLSSPMTTPPLPPQRFTTSEELGAKGHASQYDPAHFTPTLHAGLVSEILSLRRELDSKHGLVDDLESLLASTRTENDTLQSNLKRTGKETRALKRELQLHEDGTLSAMESLAKERDNVNEANGELRKRLDLSQKRLRTHEEDSRRLREALDTERTQRANEKRALERKVQVAEQRLSGIVKEFTAAEAFQVPGNSGGEQTVVGEDEAASETESTSSPSNRKKLRLDQTNSLGSIREMMKPSLADELNFIDSDDEEAVPDSPARNVRSTNKRDSQALSEASDLDLADHKTRLDQAKSKRFSRTEDGKARKVLGMVSVFEDQMKSTAEAERERNSPLLRSQSEAKRKSIDRPSMGSISEAERQLSWYSHDEEKSPIAQTDQEVKSSSQPLDVEANQRRKREPPTPRKPGHTRTQSEPYPGVKRPNEPNRTAEISPPVSLKSFATANEEGDETLPSKLPTTSIATQTEPIFEQATIPMVDINPVEEQKLPAPMLPPSRPPPPVPTDVPSITIQPPDSVPSSPSINSKRQAEVATQVRHIGSQTRPQHVIQTRSIAVQTEAIRVDQRPVKLPPHLLPSALEEQFKLDKQPDNAKSNTDAANANNHSRDNPPRTTDNILSTSDLETAFLPPLPPLEELDDDLESTDAALAPNVRRVSRSIYSSPPLSSNGSQGLDFDELDELDLSDVEHGTNLSMSRSQYRSQRLGQPSFELPSVVPENARFALGAARHSRNNLSIGSRSGRSSLEKGKKRMPMAADAASQYQNRLAFLTRNGSSAGSRSPSLNSNFSKASAARPPFVIPTRRSSKEPPPRLRSSKGSGFTSPTRGGRVSPHKAGRNISPQKVVRRGESERPPKKESKSLRKAQSAAAIKSSNGPSDTFGIPSNLGPIAQTPQKPPFTTSNVSYSEGGKDAMGNPKAPHVGTMFPTGSASVGGLKVQHNVVDAITATMIGEWMWKYTRKRISFGASEQEASDVRHKRWVWLSPYERTVMWSTKQPITNTALMGKTGRKLSIQSVIDVKDDMPPPKEARGQAVFDRSILILTPARALKFTAGSRDRHFMWLTALSFLAHQSDQTIPKYQFNPPPPPSIQESSVSSGRSRASSFRNPLRPGRSKNTSQQTSGQHTPVSQQFDPNIQHQQPKAQVPDTAFAPAVPRVPHCRKRSLTGPSRGKAGSLASVAFRGRPPLSSNNSTTSSACVQSVSGDSSRRDNRAQEDATAQPDRLRVLGQERNHDRNTRLSPRQSVGAEFGGNNSFFDAVGVMRMDAMIREPGLKSKESNVSQDDKNDFTKSHRRQSSSGSFDGPPDISRSRVPQRVGNSGLRAEQPNHETFAGF